MAQSAPRPPDDHAARPAAESLAAGLQLIQLGLEEESLHQLRAPTAGQPPLAAPVPGIAAEQILHEQFNNLVIAQDHPLAPWLARSKQGRLCYGYPLAVRRDGTVWPLFVLRMRAEPTGGGFVTQVEPWTQLRLNLGLLRQLGLDDGEIEPLRALAGDHARPFAERLSAVAVQLDLPAGRFQAGALEPAPDDYETLPDDGWVNCPLLFIAAPVPHRRALAAELAGLGQPMRRALLGETALRAVAAPAASDTAAKDAHAAPALVFDVHAAGESQTAAVRAALRHPCTVVRAPPGTGQVATVLNLIATSVLRDESVLYVSPNRATVDQIVRHVENLIGPELPFVMRIGGERENGERAQEQRDALFRLARAEAAQEAPDSGTRSKRDKPTLKSLRELEQAAPDPAAAAATLREGHRQVAEATATVRAMSLTLGPSWTGKAAARAALTFDRQALADWSDEIEALAGNKSTGFGQKVISLLSRADPRAELVREISQAYARLPAEARDPMIAAIEEDQGLTALRHAVAGLATFLDWRELVQARLEAIRRLCRRSDSRALELQQLNHTASKTSAARELFRDNWQERLGRNTPLLDKQLETFCDLLSRPSTGDARQEAQHGLKLTRAVSVLAKTLPVWAATVDSAISRLPQHAGLFDLVIVDDANEVEIGAVLPVLFRGRRALVIGAAHRQAAAPAVALADLPQIRQAAAGAPAWCRDPAASALTALSEALGSGEQVCILADHYRSHPLIADYLNRAFYGGGMRIRSNVRTLAAGLPSERTGLHWHNVVGKIAPQADGEPLVNVGEVDGCLEVLKGWLREGLLDVAPRRSFGVVSPIDHQPAALRDRLKAAMFPLKQLKKLYIGPPAMFRGKQVDFLIVMPGPAQSGPPGHNAALGQDEALFHDAIAAARIGLHVVGDHQACRMAGGYAAALADHIGGPEEAPEEAPSDPGDARFEAAFGRLEEAPVDLMTPLRKLLDAAGYAYQCNVEEQGQRFAVRLLSPHGGRYVLDFERPLEEVADAAALELDLVRDGEVAKLGYEVVRISADDLLEKADLVVERIARLA